MRLVRRSLDTRPVTLERAGVENKPRVAGKR